RSRSAASPSATSPRLADTSVLMTPPRTITPVGTPREESHNGNRFSSGNRSAVPSGEAPAISRRNMLTTTILFPIFVNRVGHSSRPHNIRPMIAFDGAAKTPTVLDMRKYMGAVSVALVQGALEIKQRNAK